jgi:deoxyadenosine/deoxycytidine kinase
VTAAAWGELMLIAIEGCLGVGKSTVAKGLAYFRGSGILLEDFESNPFLRAFYKDPASTAMETEFAFLLLHFHQLKTNAQSIGKGEIVSDFHLGKDLIYADLNLPDPRARETFRDLYALCLEKAPVPDLLVLLSSSDDLLIRRIRERDRDFEQQVDADYYASINAAYEEFFSRYEGRKISIAMNDWDFVKKPELYSMLSKLVDRELAVRV